MADGIYADIYVLTESRTAEVVQSFLDTFLPKREEQADEYELPLNADNPVAILQSAQEVIDHCVAHPFEKHAIYWRNTVEAEPIIAMIFFTDDGKLILGLSVDDESLEREFFQRLKRFAQSETGYITYENPPPLNSEEFLKEI